MNIMDVSSSTTTSTYTLSLITIAKKTQFLNNLKKHDTLSLDQNSFSPENIISETSQFDKGTKPFQ